MKKLAKSSMLLTKKGLLEATKRRASSTCDIRKYLSLSNSFSSHKEIECTKESKISEDSDLEDFEPKPKKKRSLEKNSPKGTKIGKAPKTKCADLEKRETTSKEKHTREKENPNCEFKLAKQPKEKKSPKNSKTDSEIPKNEENGGLNGEYFLFQQCSVWSCSKVSEIDWDLFSMPPQYSLGHCVAEDMKMGKGIALTFKSKFKSVDYLLGQNQKVGGLAVLCDRPNNRFIYYLVTKKHSRGKPDIEDFWKSLKKMRDHVKTNNVKYLAIPRLGCGLDGLQWYTVKSMIEFLFRKLETVIVVCNFKGEVVKSHTKEKKSPSNEYKLEKQPKEKKSPEISKTDSETPINEENDGLDGEYFLFQQHSVRICSKVTEIEKDLFSMQPYYSLGHCVAEDMKMGKGIALTFKSKFKSVDYLLGQNQKVGGLAVLCDRPNNRFIYYLVTKKHSRGKPDIEDFWKSLKKMRDHVKTNNVKYLAIPRLGCGLDGLQWYMVKSMIEFLFRKLETVIVVCNFKGKDVKSKPRKT